jgi:IclR family acetate operon transcriptional repressor
VRSRLPSVGAGLERGIFVAEDEAKVAGSIRAVNRVISVLELFKGRQELTLSEVAQETGLNNATTFRYLVALTQHGWLEPQPAGGYRLGLRVFQLGQSVAANFDISRVARPSMELLLRDFGETVNLAVYHSYGVVVIDSIESPNPLRRGASVGEQDLLFSSALGKSILACLPRDEVTRLYGIEKLKPLTDSSITTAGELFEELERSRARGYSLDNEESEWGLMCVAGAIHDRNGDPRYAVSVSGPTDRIRSSLERGLGESIASVADELSRNIGGIGEPARR